jgi:hypothetical protein
MSEQMLWLAILLCGIGALIANIVGMIHTKQIKKLQERIKYRC